MARRPATLKPTPKEPVADQAAGVSASGVSAPDAPPPVASAQKPKATTPAWRARHDARIAMDAVLYRVVPGTSFARRQKRGRLSGRDLRRLGHRPERLLKLGWIARVEEATPTQTTKEEAGS